MNNFRDKHPIRRAAPRAVKKYNEFKKDLRADYHSKCGYCNDSDRWYGGWRFFQLDHFVPKKYLTTINESEYSNLIYTCFFCNNSKRAKWPTKDETRSHDGTSGFVHPIEEEYVNHISRNKLGKIIPLTNVGLYMVKAMKLDLKRHAIIWNLDKLHEAIEQIKPLYEKQKDKLPASLAAQILELLMAQHSYQTKLFIENDA